MSWEPAPPKNNKKRIPQHYTWALEPTSFSSCITFRSCPRIYSLAALGLWKHPSLPCVYLDAHPTPRPLCTRFFLFGRPFILPLSDLCQLVPPRASVLRWEVAVPGGFLDSCVSCHTWACPITGLKVACFHLPTGSRRVGMNLVSSFIPTSYAVPSALQGNEWMSWKPRRESLLKNVGSSWMFVLDLGKCNI